MELYRVINTIFLGWVALTLLGREIDAKSYAAFALLQTVCDYSRGQPTSSCCRGQKGKLFLMSNILYFHIA